MHSRVGLVQGGVVLAVVGAHGAGGAGDEVPESAAVEVEVERVGDDLVETHSALGRY